MLALAVSVYLLRFCFRCVYIRKEKGLWEALLCNVMYLELKYLKRIETILAV